MPAFEMSAKPMQAGSKSRTAASKPTEADCVLSQYSDSSNEDMPLEGAHQNASRTPSAFLRSLNVLSFLSQAYASGLNVGDRIVGRLESSLDARLPASSETEAEDAQFLRSARSSAVGAAVQLRRSGSVIDLEASSENDEGARTPGTPVVSVDLTDMTPRGEKPSGASTIPRSPSLSALARSAGIVLRPPGDDRLVVPRAFALSARLLRRLRRAAAHSAFHLGRRNPRIPAAAATVTHIDLAAWMRGGRGGGGALSLTGLASAVGHGVGAILWPTQRMLDDLAHDRIEGRLSVTGSALRIAQAVADAAAVVTQGVVVVTTGSDGGVAVGVAGKSPKPSTTNNAHDRAASQTTSSAASIRSVPTTQPAVPSRQRPQNPSTASKSSLSSAHTLDLSRAAPRGKGPRAIATPVTAAARKGVALTTASLASDSDTGSDTGSYSDDDSRPGHVPSASSSLSGESSAARLMQLAPPLPGAGRRQRAQQTSASRRRVSVELSSSEGELPGLPIDTTDSPRRQAQGQAQAVPQRGWSPKRPTPLDTGRARRREDSARQAKALVSGVLVRTVALSTADSDAEPRPRGSQRWNDRKGPGAGKQAQRDPRTPGPITTDTSRAGGAVWHPQRADADAEVRRVTDRLRRVRGVAASHAGLQDSLRRTRRSREAAERPSPSASAGPDAKGKLRLRDLVLKEQVVRRGSASVPRSRRDSR